MRASSHTLIALAALGGLLVSGCSPATSENPSEPAIPNNPPPLTSITQLHPPLFDYAATFEEAAIIRNAKELLASRCAERFGVAYQPDLSYTALTTARDIAPRYAPFDADWVAMHGYAAQAPEFSEGRPWEPTAELLEVLYGEDADGDPAQPKDREGNPVPEMGCMTEAEYELFAEDPGATSLDRLLNQAMGEAQERMAVDSRVVKAENDWVACMDKRGYSGDSYNNVKDVHMAGEGVADDLKFAMEDLECAQEVNLPGITYAVDSAYQKLWLDEHGAEVKTLHDAFQAGLKRAKEVLSNR